MGAMENAADRLLTAGVQRGAVPGVAAVVVDRDGSVYEGAFGEREVGGGVDMTLDTVGAIYSMTKAITGAAAMQLVEQGRIELDAPAANICAELGDAAVLEGFSEDGGPVTRPSASAVTLRHLLTHTSGFVYDTWNSDMARWYEATGTPTPASREKALLLAPLMFDPGTRWQYGIGIDWVGQMIERVSGVSLGEYFTEHLTGPLGMTDTAFSHSTSMLERVATVHARMPDGSLHPIELPGPVNAEFEMGGSGLHGTMADYGRFIRMILNSGEVDGTRVLRAETVAQMSTNQIGGLRVEPLNTAIPRRSNDAEFFTGDPKSWGFTFQINEVPGHTGRPAGTLMWAGLANSYFWIDPLNGIGGAYLSQILPFVDPGSLDLFYEFERAAYALL